MNTHQTITAESGLRHDWSQAEVEALFALPFSDLIFRAQTVHRDHFDPNKVQMSTLLSIKTGGCPEDCKYCSQSSHHTTGLKAGKLMAVEEIVEDATRAKNAGASRYCMGAAWRSPKDRDMPKIIEILSAVKDLGLETCMTLGMLTPEQSQQLADAGLDYYNHNIDTSPEYYGEIITTRTFEDRLDTLASVRDAGMKVCCGGIIGMGETTGDRASMLRSLANLPAHPESVPINMLVQIEGTALNGVDQLDGLDFVRTIAVARILMPASYVRLSAGRESMSEELQALCYLAGANSIFYGEKLLTTPNREHNSDLALLDRLGISPDRPEA
ncbi:MAG TPA: biotin synthase BioB [Alphaproteobacteria bacterium]|nr:biotin synthase BioB [Alphaproteobacteria bacterium]